MTQPIEHKPMPPRSIVVTAEERGSWRYEVLTCGHLFRLKRSRPGAIYRRCWACLKRRKVGAFGNRGLA